MIKLMLVIILLYHSPVFAEMYVWYEDDGVKHISTHPKECINHNGDFNYLDCPAIVPGKHQVTYVEHIKNKAAQKEYLDSLRGVERIYAERKQKGIDTKKFRQKLKNCDINSLSEEEKHLELTAKEKLMAKRCGTVISSMKFLLGLDTEEAKSVLSNE